MCELSDLTKFMNESIAVYYPNSLCFEDPNKVKLYNSWFDSTYNSVEIVITACDQDTYNGTCESTQEIDKFLKNNVFYIIT